VEADAGWDREQPRPPGERVHQAVHAAAIGGVEKLGAGRATVGAMTTVGMEIRYRGAGLEGEERTVWERQTQLGQSVG
jgi:hypothetical protein